MGTSRTSSGAHTACVLLAMVAMSGCRSGCVAGPSGASANAEPTVSTESRRLTLFSDAACVLTRAGELQCWGPGATRLAAEAKGAPPLACLVDDDEQQACPPRAHLPNSVSEHGLRAVGNLCIVDEQGGHYCMSPGEAVWETPTQIERVTAISGSSHSGCLIDVEGTLTCWFMSDTRWTGEPLEASELGDLHLTALAPESQWARGCGVDVRGDVWCWRRASAEGSSGWELTQRKLEPDAVADLSVSRSHACVRLVDGRGMCWSLDDACPERFGIPRSSDEPPAAIEGLPALAELRAGEDATCARTLDDEVWCWGASQVWGGPRPGARARPHEVLGVEEARALAVTANQSCAALESGAVLCWGRWGSGKIGPHDRCRSYEAQPVEGVEDATAISLGPRLGCAVSEAGRVSCWGPDHDLDPDPELAITSALPGTSTALAVATEEVCAIQGAGQVRCWAIPDDRPFEANVELQVSSSQDRAHSLVAHGQRTCAVTDTGGVHCWSREADQMSSIPGPEVQGVGALAWSADLDCWLGGGRVECREGRNAAGLGRELEALVDARALSVSGTNVCIVDAKGRVLCAGFLDEKLGVPSDAPAFGTWGWATLELPGPTRALGFGEEHGCALGEDGRVRCWGRGGEDGQYGDGLAPASPRPVRLDPPTVP